MRVRFKLTRMAKRSHCHRFAATLGASAVLFFGCLLDTSNLVGGRAGAPDGSADSALSVDASDGGAFRCADYPAALFCSDFDETPYDVGWDNHVDIRGGQSGATTTDFLSPPRSLLATIPAHDATTLPFAGVAHAITSRAFSVAWDMWIDDPSGQTDVELGGFSFLGNPYYAVWVLYSRGLASFQLSEYGGAYQGHPELSSYTKLSHGLKIQAWSHVEMRIELSTGASQVEVVVDGASNGVMPLSAGTYLLPSTKPNIALGIVDGEGTGAAYRTRVDNVLVIAR
jgi:hypothetical protein